MKTSNTNDEAEIRRGVREHYANAVASTQEKPCCCGGSDKVNECCGEPLLIYEDPAVSELPEEVTEISLGCGDPVTLASLLPGQTVLDLGSGGGIDCFLAAKKVGPTGKVIGVDMTLQMLDRARANQRKLGFDNVDFRLGEIEHLPVADHSVDVVISNCVINLSTDKPQVFAEIFRVLKPGGKMAVSDIVTDGELPESVRASLSAWAGCIAGALDYREYQALIAQAGFKEVVVKPVYFTDEMIQEAAEQIKDADLTGVDITDMRRAVFSSKITAQKP